MCSTSITSLSTEDYSVIRDIVNRLLQLTIQKMKDDRFDLPDYSLSELPDTALIREKGEVIQFLLKIDGTLGVRWAPRVPTEWVGFGNVTERSLIDLTPEQQLLVKLVLAAYPNPYQHSAS